MTVEPTNFHKSKQPKGQILLFGPSYSGKSYLTQIFREMGLCVYDLEKEGNFILWVNIKTGKPVSNDLVKTTKWLSENLYLLQREETRKFLADKSDCIVFAHSYDILDQLDLFTRAYFMYVPISELKRRMKLKRDDHRKFSRDQINFMLERHTTRLKESKELGIPIVDVSQSPVAILKNISVPDM